MINEVFTPSKEELTRATDDPRAYKKADMDQGLGAIVYKDEMVDAATLRVEWKKLAVARKAGLPVMNGRAGQEAARAPDALGYANQAALRAGVAATPRSASRASIRSRAASTRRCISARLWTMRQYAGFGTPSETNQRFKYLLE